MWKNGKGDIGWRSWTTIKSNLVLTITEGTNVSNKLFRCFHVFNSWLLTTVFSFALYESLTVVNIGVNFADITVDFFARL